MSPSISQMRSKLVKLALMVMACSPLWQSLPTYLVEVPQSKSNDASPPPWGNATRVNEWLQNPQKPPATPGAFLHISKSGGSTLAPFLRNACHSWVKKPCNPNVPNETRISLLTTYYHVPDFDKLHKHHYQFYTVTLRDPLDRTRSSFSAYHMANFMARRQAGFRDSITHMKKRKEFSDCFPSFQDFVATLGRVYSLTDDTISHSRPSQHCWNVAHALWEHDENYAYHIYWDIRNIHQIMVNYSGIWDGQGDDKPILLVVRTEHLWKDWVSANQVLGQDQVELPNTTVRGRDYRRIDLPVQLNVTMDGQRMLCEALRTEYEAYFSFLRHAQNLLDADRQASMEQSRQNCPWLDLSL